MGGQRYNVFYVVFFFFPFGVWEATYINGHLYTETYNKKGFDPSSSEIQWYALPGGPDPGLGYMFQSIWGEPTQTQENMQIPH